MSAVKKYLLFIAAVVLLLILLLAPMLMCKAQATKSYPATSFARADTLQGLYIFFGCNPVQKSTVLGTVTLTYTKYPTYQFFNEAAAYSKLRYPSAQALIFFPKATDTTLVNWQVIKF